MWSLWESFHSQGLNECAYKSTHKICWQVSVKSKQKAVRIYWCDFCGKTFRAKDYINVHIKLHTGERPYVCGICARGFVSLTLLLHNDIYHIRDESWHLRCSYIRFTIIMQLLGKDKLAKVHCKVPVLCLCVKWSTCSEAGNKSMK